MNAANFVLALLSLMLLALLAWGIFDWYRRRKKNARVQLPEGAVYIRTERVSKKLSGSLVGSYMLVGAGTYGLNQLWKLLVLLHRCGLEGIVGSILALDHDVQMVSRFMSRVPKVFHERIETSVSEAMAGGAANRSTQWVLDHVARWGVPVEKAARGVCDKHLRLNRSQAPAAVLLFLSQGGQAPMSLLPLEIIRKRFRETLIMGFTALPRHERLRARFPELRKQYEQRGVQGWVIQDNLNPDSATLDFGMVATPVALADAALNGDQATQPNNALSLLFPEERGGEAIYQVVSKEIVGFPFHAGDSEPRRYYARRQSVVDAITDALDDIENGEGIWSTGARERAEGTSIFDVVLVPVGHDVLSGIKDEVLAGQKLRAVFPPAASNGQIRGRGSMVDFPNYELCFASMAEAIEDPVKPTCKVVVVRLVAVRNPATSSNEENVARARRLLGFAHVPSSNATHPNGANQQQTPAR
jgi:hypothetical protein